MASPITVQHSTTHVNIKDRLSEPVLFTGSTYNILTDERTTWTCTISFQSFVSHTIDYTAYQLNGYGHSEWRTTDELSYMIIGTMNCKSGAGKLCKHYFDDDTLEQYTILYTFQLYMLQNKLHMNLCSDIAAGTLIAS